MQGGGGLKLPERKIKFFHVLGAPRSVTESTHAGGLLALNNTMSERLRPDQQPLGQWNYEMTICITRVVVLEVLYFWKKRLLQANYHLTRQCGKYSSTVPQALRLARSRAKIHGVAGLFMILIHFVSPSECHHKFEATWQTRSLTV